MVFPTFTLLRVFGFHKVVWLLPYISDLKHLILVLQFFQRSHQLEQLLFTNSLRFLTSIT